jgi:hypothetical protein
MKLHRPTLLLLAVTSFGLLHSGCTVVAVGGLILAEGALESAAMRPYDQALSRGRMTPNEYRQQLTQVERGVDALFHPPPPVPRRR